MSNKISGLQYRGLNVGCGPYYMDGWLNTEYEQGAAPSEPHLQGSVYKADIFGDFFDLRYILEIQSFDKIYFGHFLEHIHENKIIECIHIAMSLLKDGGELMVVGPDYNKALQMGITDPFLTQIGKHNYNNDPNHPYSHKWESTEERTIDYMRQAGLKNVTAVPAGYTLRPQWPNTATDAWQLFVVGKNEISYEVF